MSIKKTMYISDAAACTAQNPCWKISEKKERNTGEVGAELILSLGKNFYPEALLYI